MNSIPKNANNRKCLWMQAGVVRQKYCRLEHSCAACRYDRVMRRKADENNRLMRIGKIPGGKGGKIIFWKDRLKALPQWKRPCIHHMRGNIDFRACTNEYNCSNCEFNQYFQDQYIVHTVVRPVDVLEIKGFKVPQGYYLHRGHTWVKIEEGAMARIGIDDFALRVLGPPDRIEAPLIGKSIGQNQGDIALTRGKNKARVMSPISGVVTDINPELRETGATAHDDPYSGGWVLRVHSKTLRQDLKSLSIGDETTEFLKNEVRHLYGLIEDVAGPLAADGGQLGDDLFGNLPEIGWDRLIRTFLHTH